MSKKEEMKSKIVWRCPSNIAIVKYWGKKDNQIPANPSISMTLSKSYTELEVDFSKKEKNEFELDYFFEGSKNLAFEERILKYLSANINFFPVLDNFKLSIDSRNSFPHSAGIASSASAFGAIALALLDASFPNLYHENPTDFFDRASNLARLGSGSACRSMYSGFSLWGKVDKIKESSDEHAVQLKQIHESFANWNDSILIIDKEPKKVSSSLGHSLMNGHAYAQERFVQAKSRVSETIHILDSGDIEKFIEITESEALTLHAMMMTSPNPYLLMKSGTIEAIEKIQQFRKREQLPICFTLDAGPNVHVLYPSIHERKVEDFLLGLMEGQADRIIKDKIGKGPVKIQ